MRFEQVPKEKFILRPQVRMHPPEYLRRLADSLLQGQLQPVGVLKDFTVIFGNGRVLAARLEPQITHLYAAILDEEITEKEFFRRQAVENFVTNPLSNAEKCKICCEYVNNEPHLPLKQIASELGVDPSMISKWRRWEHCIDLVQQALECDSITLQTMIRISEVPKDQQEAALAKLVMPKKERKSNGKVSRGTFQMPSGAVVTIASDGLTMAGIIEELTGLLKEAKRASEQGLDPKTFSAVLKDKSKAG